MAEIPKTPGVYIQEKSEFPNSAVPVPTAVPAFVGYTEKAIRNNKSLKNVPTRLSSFSEFLLFFGGAPNTTYAVATDPGSVFQISNPKSRFLLYYSIKLFFANGGSDCYIVSIGDYSQEVKISDFDGEAPILDATGADTGAVQVLGIRTLRKEREPTLLVIPDAVLLSKSECGAVQKRMLRHCYTMGSCFAILDVPMSAADLKQPDTNQIIETFRNNIGTENLQWGAAYYPYLATAITGSDEVSFRNIDPAKNAVLMDLLLDEVAATQKQGLMDDKQASAITAEINQIAPNNPVSGEQAETARTLHQGLLAISPLYKKIMNAVRHEINILPPSAGMAGVYSMVDNNIGVFQAPANVSIGSVAALVVQVTNKEQEDLNVPLHGKAINAIRTFPGKGMLVWGARTLDGNSQDWRYISVRRTVIFIEQSIKYAIEPYVFAPNTAATWANVQALITNFLTNVWKIGALAGATPKDAFSVNIGLGVTMTPVDILDGIMRVSVQVALTRPAEFIVLTFQQKMQSS